MKFVRKKLQTEGERANALMLNAQTQMLFGGLLLIPNAGFSVLLAMESDRPTMMLLGFLWILAAPLLPLYLAVFREIRVMAARKALALLSAGCSFAGFYAANHLFGCFVGLSVGAVLPYLVVRIIGWSLVSLDRSLSGECVRKLNQR